MNDLPTDPDAADVRSDNPGGLRGMMRWWRGLGLAAVLLALYLFSEEQDVAGYAALALGWAILIYAIIARTRYYRRMRN